jgi:hypothetical protein
VPLHAAAALLRQNPFALMCTKINSMNCTQKACMMKTMKKRSKERHEYKNDREDPMPS